MHFSKRRPHKRAESYSGRRRRVRLKRRESAVSRNHHEYALRRYYRALYQAWGAQHWWPAETQFEVIVGAYLTQNTAWTNVERALENLRVAQMLSLDGIRKARLARLERLIRPSGYFRQKARRLKTFVAFLDKNYSGSLAALFAQPTARLREELLKLNGVGPETADSILLYAGNHSVFVVDAYTRRVLDRHGILPEKSAYEEIRELCECSLAPLAQETLVLPAETVSLASGFRGAAHTPSAMSTASRTALAQVYNEMHGLIVGVGKQYCRKAKAACENCPLRPYLPAK